MFVGLDAFLCYCNSSLVLVRKYFRKIKCGDCRALSSQGRFRDVQCSHLIARSPCDFCPKRRSISFFPTTVNRYGHFWPCTRQTSDIENDRRLFGSFTILSTNRKRAEWLRYLSKSYTAYTIRHDQQYAYGAMSKYSKSFQTNRAGRYIMSALGGLFGDSDETVILAMQQTQLSLSPIINTPAYTNVKAKPYSSPSPQQSCSTHDQSLHTVASSYNFQAHQPSPQLESAEQYQTESSAPNSSMLTAERAIVLKGMYINLIRDLHQLATSGALLEDEYQLQKTIILRQMLAL